MAVGAARSAIRHREPAGRRQQYRHRGGRAGAAGRLHAAPGRAGERHQRDALRQAQLQLHPRHRAGRGHRPRATRHGGQSVGSGEDGSRVHRLCQGQSGQDQHGVGRQRDPLACRRRAVQDDGRRRHDPRALPRRGARASRSDRRPGAGACSVPCLTRSNTSGRASCARWRSRRATRSEVLPDIPSVERVLAGLRGEYTGTASARRRTRRPRSSTSSTGRSTRRSPIPR